MTCLYLYATPAASPRLKCRFSFWLLSFWFIHDDDDDYGGVDGGREGDGDDSVEDDGDGVGEGDG